MKGIRSLFITLGLVLFPRMAAAQPAFEEVPCSTVVGTLVTQLVFRTPLSGIPRVELRQCAPGTSENIQIVAWEPNRKIPSLVIDTSDFSVVQTAARGNFYLIETTGGPRNRVFVIVYEAGKPTLKLKRVTRGTAKISMTNDAVTVVVPDIYAGDAEPRTETHRFPLK